MLCLLGSVHTVKSNCLKAVVLGFVFFPRFFPIPLYPTLPEHTWNQCGSSGPPPSWKGGAGCSRPGSGAGSTVAPACSCCLTHFSSTLCCVWKGPGPRGPAHSAGTRWVDGPAPHPAQSPTQPRERGLAGSGCFGEPHIPPVEECPAGCSYLQPRPARTAGLPARPGPTAAPAAQRKCLGVLGVPQALLGGLLPTFPLGSQLSLPLGVK